MKIAVRVKPGSMENSIEPAGNNEYILRVKERAHDGLANKAAVKLLSEYFKVPKSRISIARGLSSRNKIIDMRL